MSKPLEPTGADKEHAQALITKAWRARHKTLHRPPTDEATLEAIMAGIEADIVRACEICKQTGATSELSVALGKLGHVALDLDRPNKARRLFEESVSAAGEADDPLRLAHALRHLGQVNHRLSRPESAARCYEEALDVYERAETAHPLDRANTLRPMAALRGELGDVEGARHLWREAAKLYQAVGVEAGIHECEAQISSLDSQHRGCVQDGASTDAR